MGEATRLILAYDWTSHPLCGPGITLDVDVPEAACHAHVDRSQFDTAIVNMAVNAREAMAGQGDRPLGFAVPRRR